jgi:hypothetical protein
VSLPISGRTGRGPAVVVALTVALVAAFWVTSAIAGPKSPAPPPPPPTITSGPTGTIGATTATFTYSDTAAGATFECSLDSGPFKPCATGGVTYRGLGEGVHLFRVTAQVGASASSGAASRTWTVDVKPPTATLSFPTDKAKVDVAGYTAGCSPQGLCGTAADTTGVSTVKVSVRQERGQWWNGNGFTSATEVFTTATLASSGASSTAWNLPLARPADGTYTVRVQTADTRGNAQGGATYAADVTFTVDTFDKKSFQVSGSTTQPFSPGVSQPLNLAFTNPNSQAIDIVSVDIVIEHETIKNGNPNSGCDGPTNLTVTRPFSAPVSVPRNSTKSLQQLGIPPGQWPELTMPNLASNQDACKGATFKITYTGTATK